MSIARFGANLLVAGLAAWATAASGALQDPTLTAPALESSIVLVGKTPAREPGGYARLCAREPAVCQTPTHANLPVEADGRVRLDAWAVRTAIAVNAYVNHAIVPEAESPDAEDFWKVGGETGDCEDFALAKRERLIQAGFPASSLVMATAYLPNGDYHAVLLLRADTGDYVLDNLAEDVLPVPRSRLRFRIIQSAVDPRVWLSL